MKKRLLAVMVTGMIALTGCTTGGPNDVALVGGKAVTQAQVQELVDSWAQDPLYTALVEVAGPEVIEGRARDEAQQVLVRQRMLDGLLKNHPVELPDEAAVDARIEEATKALGGLDGLKEQAVQGVQQTGQVQGTLSFASIRDQIKVQLIVESIMKTIDITDDAINAFLITNGLDPKTVDEELKQSARSELATQRIQEEVTALGLSLNPRIVLADGTPILGPTATNPQAGNSGAGAPPIQVAPAGQAPQPESPAGEGEGDAAATEETATPEATSSDK